MVSGLQEAIVLKNQGALGPVDEVVDVILRNG